MARKDGKRAIYIDPMMQLSPYIMTRRSDATNTAKVEIRCDAIEQFITDQREKGEVFTYNDVVVASLVRLYSKRWQLNRFVVGRKIYDRYKMTVAFVIKKGLRDNSAETTVKVDFDGSEDIYEVRNKINAVVEENLVNSDVNVMDLVVAKLMRLPSWLLIFFVGLIKFSDRIGLFPKVFMDASPFHTSCFITFLKSIKSDYVYHHIYDFGTTGLFFAMGRDKFVPSVNPDKSVTAEKTITMGVTMDERFADGLYLANSVRLWTSLLQRPEQLLEKGDKMFTKEIVLQRRAEQIKIRKMQLRELRVNIKKNTKALKEQRKRDAKKAREERKNKTK